jgi:hypothetical protein
MKLENILSLNRVVSQCGNILRGYFTASDGIEYKLETDTTASEWLLVIGTDGTAERFDLASGSNFSTGVQWTEEWTQADWDAVNSALAEGKSNSQRN